jgi:[methyl-Co(III) methanol-specific corrinoid protein]:coenzyme M methyltransferase
MNDISPKERLARAIEKRSVDRKPVVCPGGMMNAAITDVMRLAGHHLPAAHTDARLMSELSADVCALTGFENLGLPFCMTVEAEVLGSEIDFGSLECEAKIAREAFASVSAVRRAPVPELLDAGRIETICDAAYRLSKENDDMPVIGSLTGPVSTAASIVDPMTFLKELRKDPENAARTLDYVTDFLIGYAMRLLESGADLITIGDPTATGEILGPAMFEKYAIPSLNRLLDEVRKADRKAILHICGDISSVRHLIPRLRADVISTDAMVDLKALKRDFPELVTMGNMSTYMLERGDPERIRQRTESLAASTIDIMAPACGLSASSTLENLNAFTGTVKGSGR